jgi:hypothetical protein
MSIAANYSNEKLVWWILGLTVSMTGVLGLLILNSITGRLHDLNADVSNLQGRVVLVERVVSDVGALNSEQRSIASKVALMDSLVAGVNNLGEQNRDMYSRLVTIENLINERTERKYGPSPQGSH